MSWERIPTRLPGLIAIRPTVHADDRGLFFESYRRDQMVALGVTIDILQENHARSTRGTLRGLHYQVGRGQAKLVRCARGIVVDVVVDIRVGSPTFGEWEALTLDDQDHVQLFVPVGFAHGYYVLSDVADVLYAVDAYYDPILEAGIAWNDPAVGVVWPEGTVTMSTRDRANPLLANAKGLPRWPNSTQAED